MKVRVRFRDVRYRQEDLMGHLDVTNGTHIGENEVPSGNWKPVYKAVQEMLREKGAAQ